MARLQVRKFHSHAEQRLEEIQYYRSLTPEERFQIFVQLQRRVFGPPEKWRSAKTTVSIRYMKPST
jgi:hypothetical protein